MTRHLAWTCKRTLDLPEQEQSGADGRRTDGLLLQMSVCSEITKVNLTYTNGRRI